MFSQTRPFFLPNGRFPPRIEQMSQDDLSAKLRRLGVVKGARELKPAPPKLTPELLPQRPFSPPVSLPQPEPDDWRTADDVVSLEQMLPGSKLVETAASWWKRLTGLVWCWIMFTR